MPHGWGPRTGSRRRVCDQRSAVTRTDAGGPCERPDGRIRRRAPSRPRHWWTHRRSRILASGNFRGTGDGTPVPWPQPAVCSSGTTSPPGERYGTRRRTDPDAETGIAQARDRPDQHALGLDGFHHRVWVVVRGAEGPPRGRPRSAHLVGDRRGGDPRPRAGPCRTGGDVPGLRRIGPLPSLRLRRRGRGVFRLVLVAAGGDGGTHRGVRDDQLRDALLVRARLVEREPDADHEWPGRGH